MPFKHNVDDDVDDDYYYILFPLFCLICGIITKPTNIKKEAHVMVKTSLNDTFSII